MLETQKLNKDISKYIIIYNVNNAFIQRATPSGQYTPQRLTTPVPNRRQELQETKDEPRMLELQRSIRQMESQEAEMASTSFSRIQNQTLQLPAPTEIPPSSVAERPNPNLTIEIPVGNLQMDTTNLPAVSLSPKQKPRRERCTHEGMGAQMWRKPPKMLAACQ